jgi:hypothetical protein
LVLYWNNYGIENAPMENEIQKIYTKHGMKMKDEESVCER